MLFRSVFPNYCDDEIALAFKNVFLASSVSFICKVRNNTESKWIVVELGPKSHLLTTQRLLMLRTLIKWQNKKSQKIVASVFAFDISCFIHIKLAQILQRKYRENLSSSSFE